MDESGSMGSVQANLRNNIAQFAGILSAGGVDATYALVGYGGSFNNVTPNYGPRLLTNFTSPAGFATAAQNLAINGFIEPGYSAILYALNALDNQGTTLNYRVNSLPNIIILTDEPSNGDSCAAGLCFQGASVTQAVVDTVLKQNQALLNAVLSGFGTNASYATLATGNGGQVFNLSQFGSNNLSVVQQFVADFASRKLREIIDNCQNNPNLPGCNGGGTPVPEPATLALLLGGLLSLGAVRRLAT